MLRQPAANRIDNRFVEIAMIQRAEELGGSPVHALLGISHDKMLSFFNIERDLVAQYYSMGIIGVVLFSAPFSYCSWFRYICCSENFKRILV